MEMAEMVEMSDDILKIHRAMESIAIVSETIQKHLNTVSTELELRSFQFDTMQIKPKKGPLRIYVKKLLLILGLEKNVSITMGLFLKSLNQYLIDNKYINHETFEVILSPLIGLAFDIHPSYRTVHYSSLIKSTALMFD